MKMHPLVVRAVPALVASFATFASPASALEVERVATLQQAAGGNVPSGLIVGGVGTLGNDYVAVLSRNRSSDGRITRGQADSTFNVVQSGTQLTFAGLDPQGFTVNDALSPFGNGVIFTDALAQQVVRYSPTGGTTRILATSDLTAATGGTGVSLSQGQAVLPDGSFAFLDLTSRSILRTNGTAGNVSTFAGSGDLLAGPLGTFGPAEDARTIRYLGVAGGDLYFGVDSLNSVFKLDANAANPAATVTQVFTAAEIVAATGFETTGTNTFQAAGFALGGDGLMYLRDSRSRAILRFDPTLQDPTLGVALGRSDLEASVAGSSLLSGIFPTSDGVGFYTATGGVFAIVPEPATTGMLAVGSLALLRRRRG